MAWRTHTGYLRRQARFYFWRIVSKLAAIVFYLFISTVLRYGPNSQYYNFSEDPYISLTDESGTCLSFWRVCGVCGVVCACACVGCVRVCVWCVRV